MPRIRSISTGGLKSAISCVSMLADAVLGAEGAAERVRDVVDGVLDAMRDRVGIVEARATASKLEERNEVHVAVAEMRDDDDRHAGQDARARPRRRAR